MVCDWLLLSLKSGKPSLWEPISGCCNDGIMVITHVMNGIFMGFIHDNHIQWIMENPIDYGGSWWLDRLCRNEMDLSIIFRHSHIIHIIHFHSISRYCMVTQNAKRKSQRRILKQTCADYQNQLRLSWCCYLNSPCICFAGWISQLIRIFTDVYPPAALGAPAIRCFSVRRAAIWRCATDGVTDMQRNPNEASNPFHPIFNTPTRTNDL